MKARLTPFDQTGMHLHDRYRLEWIDGSGALRVSFFSTEDGLQRHLTRHGLVLVAS